MSPKPAFHVFCQGPEPRPRPSPPPPPRQALDTDATMMDKTDYEVSAEMNRSREDVLRREYFAETQNSYLLVCQQHRDLFERYNALPVEIRASSQLEPQLEEAIDEFSLADGYADTFWSPLLAMLGDVTAKGDASFDELRMVDDFVGRVHAQNVKMREAMEKLELRWSGKNEDGTINQGLVPTQGCGSLVGPD